LLSNITQYIHQQIFVVDADNHEILMTNDMADEEIEKNPDYLKNILALLKPREEGAQGSHSVEIGLETKTETRHFAITRHLLTWNGRNAEALIVDDISAEKTRLIALEKQAHYDALTGVYNRFYGMSTLRDWIDVGSVFALIFLDMDNLKYINDTYGHKEGDRYITSVANTAKIMPEDTVISRIGGDEFMLLVPNITTEKAEDYVRKYLDALSDDEYLTDKDYTYRTSYGIVAVDEKNNLTSGEILDLADSRMYENKQKQKKIRSPKDNRI